MSNSESIVPHGYCHCGCGRKVELPKYCVGHYDREEMLRRFWAKVNKGAPAECWEWAAGWKANGYGRLKVGGKPWMAHRWIFSMVHGPIPSGLFVCHKCDNPSCVNPGHLFLGSHRENMDDRTAKRRMPHGERHRSAKLTDDDVRFIRSLIGKKPKAEIARMFNVSPNAIYDVADRTTWRHVA